MKTITIKRYATVLLWGLFIFLSSSCEDFLEVDTPNYLLSGETIFTDTKTVEAAMVGIYAQLRNNVLLTGNPQGLSVLLGTYTDELDYYSPYPLPEEPFHKNTLLATNPTVAEVWNGCYNQIYAANAILEGVADSIYFTPDEIASFKGEALFIRALIHFYLVNIYGDIPYITTTNYHINKNVEREAKEIIYAKIISDLEEARQLLPATDLSGKKVRPYQAVATALLARVQLYAENWEQASQLATLVIDETPWESDPTNVFLKESPSILWQFQPEFEGQNTFEAQNFIFEAAPPPARALTTTLMDAFEPGDLRKDLWTGAVTDGSQTFYYPYKYQHRAGEPFNAEYSVVLRLAELYLVRAEANANLGNLSAAASDINKIRERAGLSPTTATAQETLLNAVLKERRVELFTEHGHRFFDLKRTANLDGTLISSKPNWNTTDRLFPIPEKELLLNPALNPQNPGY
ncbi:hypothetical protein LS48_01975 [Aequorivita aquimaris]|uniref:RagB/SusD family nutrient uptake outer membrane protein n=1 Tax=Aequorivita aquimaris TaxID=1548749 RepID=A0A137RM63_9FLAO|nr:RagB/SusD family nutrient uptake outer membrane protein [Aequorivita aquimaris]KXO01255.1 hypothetical protein LS48_01975 [Aequorivita aquimaris]